jgi:hypothetical protein
MINIMIWLIISFIKLYHYLDLSPAIIVSQTTECLTNPRNMSLALVTVPPVNYYPTNFIIRLLSNLIPLGYLFTILPNWFPTLLLNFLTRVDKLYHYYLMILFKNNPRYLILFLIPFLFINYLIEP